MNQSLYVSCLLDTKMPKVNVSEHRQTIHHLKAMMDDIPGAIYWKDKAGIYRGHNATSAEKMAQFKLLSKPIIGHTDYGLFPKAVAAQYRTNDLEVMEFGQSFVYEERLVLKNSEVVFQLSSKKPLRDDHGEIVGIIGNTIDVTPCIFKKIEIMVREDKENTKNIKLDFKSLITALNEHQVEKQKSIISFTRKYYLTGNYKDVYITKREFDCLSKIVIGYTVQETAELLNLSVRTIESYINNIKNKLGVMKKSEVIRIVLKHGLKHLLLKDL